MRTAKERACIASLPDYEGMDPGWLHGMFECDAHPEAAREQAGVVA
jgi:hypothetical protein